MQPDALIYGLRIRNGLIVLGHGDEFQLQHFVQASLAATCIILRVPDGIVACGVLGDGSDDRAFGKGQFTAGLAEVSLGSGFHAQSVLA